MVRERGSNDVELFRRHPDDGSELTEIGCPDCRGQLRVTIRPDEPLAFACRIGHRFLDDTLLPIKEDELEATLWAAVERYEELALLHEGLAVLAERQGDDASTLRERATRAMAHAATIRELIARDGPARAMEPHVGHPA